jgi:acetyl-CoA C-acetyltransferase
MMSKQRKLSGRPVYVVDGARTPFLKMRGKVGPFKASTLATYCGRQLLHRQKFDTSRIDQVVMGCVGPAADEANIARLIALRLGLGHRMPAFTVQRNCASGLQAIDVAARSIAHGESDIVLCGGTESMSHAPLLFKDAMTNWLQLFQRAKTFGQKAQALAQFRVGMLTPVVALLKGLTDAYVNLNMGQTAEEIAFRFGITREDMDKYAERSHQFALKAQEQHYFDDEIVALFDDKGNLYDKDDGIRPDISPEKLAKLKPVFDKFGNVTAGNSSQVTDGACVLLLASEEAVNENQLPVLGRVVDFEWAALDPSVMGLGPVHAITPLLTRHQLQLADLDCMEINEAFAAQLLGCLKAWKDTEYCQKSLGLSEAFGDMDLNKVNPDGGAIALGHPVGASGARVVLHLLHHLRRQQGRLGVASLCIGGGQGGAVLVEAC